MEKIEYSPKVSIIIPVHNRATILPNAITSVLFQTHQNFECIIVDDGSTDKTVESAMRSTAYMGNRFTVVRWWENRGPSFARNLWVAFSSGEYVTFLDSDDEYLPHHIALRVEYLLKNPHLDYLYGSMLVHGDDFVVDKDDRNRKIPISETSMGATAFMRRSVFDTLGWYDVSKKYGEDGDLLERAKESWLNIERVRWPTYVYNRGLPDSLTTIAENHMEKELSEIQ